MPLMIAPKNELLKIVKILLDEKTKKHLESLGITINSNLTLLDSSSGSVILVVKDGRLALDNEIARRIFVV